MVETAIQCFRVKVFSGFSGHGNSIYNIIPLQKKIFTNSVLS